MKELLTTRTEIAEDLLPQRTEGGKSEKSKPFVCFACLSPGDGRQAFFVVSEKAPHSKSVSGRFSHKTLKRQYFIGMRNLLIRLPVNRHPVDRG
jgi:hypothetical protein